MIGRVVASAVRRGGREGSRRRRRRVGAGGKEQKCRGIVGDDDTSLDRISDEYEEDVISSPSSREDDGDYNDDGDDESLERKLRLSRPEDVFGAANRASNGGIVGKITKIELDRTIREACQRILWHYEDEDGVRGWNACCHPLERTPDVDDRRHHRRQHPYSSPPPPPPLPLPPPPPFPSVHHRHQFDRRHRGDRVLPSKMQDMPHGYDGWMGTTGEVVTMEVGRLRSAAALI